MTVEEIHGVRVLTVPGQGPAIRGGADALDLIAASFEEQAEFVVIPVERLDPAFFTLSNGLAGEFLQKLVNYRLRVAIVGDVSAHVEGSNALRDFVRESNRRKQNWFLASRDELRERLASEVAVSPEA
ncbi:DUF4180 domain-containing protein [Phytohabitans sp. ZYX-F-186]|uniref:DUF4180 domain-containing protein n=1 Tax=Phytohabitans maris TaxID=3071409 RepID=A0ABU0ZAZ9_9ACTN|nr:DUF4180 domain-containing protein [Phytohabitans sp. ZYX-F-186]MDQ7904210.1 DUF4180 domain-containing protein [Phytohabitans sp. ZYX-F-186]